MFSFLAESMEQLDTLISFAARARQSDESGTPEVKQSILSQVAQSLTLVRENQTDKTLLLEPFLALVPFFSEIDENTPIEPKNSGSDKEKTTSDYSEVAFGVPNESLIKLSKHRSQLPRLAYQLVKAQSELSGTHLDSGQTAASRVVSINSYRTDSRAMAKVGAL